MSCNGRGTLPGDHTAGPLTRAGTLVLLLASLVAPAQSVRAQTPSPLYLVVPFENASSEARLYWLSEASAVVLTDNLIARGAAAVQRDDRLRAFEHLRVPPVATLSHATIIRIGQVVGAAYVVLGAFDVKDQALVVRARTIRLDTGRLSPELEERGALVDLLDIYARLAGRVAPDAAPGAAQPPPYPSLPAFEQYIKGLLAESLEARTAFLTQAIRLAPAFQRARVALWEIHTERGAHQQALDLVRDIPPDHRLARQARFLAGVSMLHLGQSQAAFDTFSELNRDRPDPALLNNLGVVQLRRAGQPSGAAAPRPAGGAVSYFGEAIKLDANDPDLFFNLGYTYWLDRDPQGAIYWLREAVRRNPADDAAHYVLGVALQAAGSTAEAAREKELARRLSSTYVEWEAKQPAGSPLPGGLERIKQQIDVPESMRVGAAVVAAEQRDQQAIAAFHLERGRRLFDEGHDEEAIGELRRTVFLSPYESDAHLLLGRIYLRTGREQEAIEALTIAIWSDPGNAEAKALLGSLK
ncbi:MAG: hypothetical protein A3F70_14925 [Acidobacteria bacterium RIFCSPLOWO2_12_FULL_67_14]|nr:MAG: hypothetical protein A3H29_12240 [Acidobacteria bacterium RIFCSPLOWO2_02_FULL_67_21]OFW35790.1 MAG: hypothetical protein A3F70_14925 [Acidobacteria bacterium RIFCSPLOWO2_12_FULL_67_14]